MKKYIPLSNRNMVNKATFNFKRPQIAKLVELQKLATAIRNY